MPVGIKVQVPRDNNNRQFDGRVKFHNNVSRKKIYSKVIKEKLKLFKKILKKAAKHLTNNGNL